MENVVRKGEIACNKQFLLFLQCFSAYIAVENVVRKGEIACNKQFLLFSQCFLRYMVLIFRFKCTLTLSQTTHFRLFQIESLQTTISNLMKIPKNSPNGYNAIWENDKLLDTSNFSFSHSVVKKPLLQTRKKNRACL